MAGEHPQEIQISPAELQQLMAARGGGGHGGGHAVGEGPFTVGFLNNIWNALPGEGWQKAVLPIFAGVGAMTGFALLTVPGVISPLAATAVGATEGIALCETAVQTAPHDGPQHPL